MTLNVSLVLPSSVLPDPRRLDQLLDLAEQVDATPGWHGIYVSDSILALGFYDSTVLLSALAARTRTVRLGVACLSTLGLRHPLIVAQQWANLDALSAGRMTLIACVGNKNGEKHERERAAFGMDYTEKLARMEDGLQFLRRARHEEVITYTSKYLDLHDVRIVPSFTQETLPIWMVANPSAGAREEGVRRVLRRVAQLGDGWLTYNITPELLRERVDVLAQLRREEGQTETGQPVAVQVNYTIGDTEQEAVDIATRAWGRYNSRGVSIDKLRTISAIGTAKQAASFINELYAAGATEVLLHPLDDDTARQVERASTQFLPLLPTGAKLA